VAAEAQRAGIDPAGLLDSRKFQQRLAELSLDPDGALFGSQVRELVASARTSVPALQRSAPVPSSAPLAPPAAPQEPAQWGQEQLDRASPAEVLAAAEAGLLRDYAGMGTRRRRR